MSDQDQHVYQEAVYDGSMLANECLSMQLGIISARSI